MTIIDDFLQNPTGLPPMPGTSPPAPPAPYVPGYTPPAPPAPPSYVSDFLQNPTGLPPMPGTSPPAPVEPAPAPTGRRHGQGAITVGSMSFPTSISEWWRRSVMTPTLSPVGLTIGGGTKFITKAAGSKILPFVIGGGLVAAVMSLFGGGKQEQQMAITPTITPTQDTDISPMMELLNKIFTTIGTRIGVGDTTVTGSTVYGGVASPYTYTYPTTITETYSPQITETHSTQITETTTTGGQTAMQQDTGWMILAAAAIIGGAFLLKENQ